MSRARMAVAAWIALGAALACWLAGDLTWVLAPGARTPFPSRADWLWLAGYPAAFAGLALLLRARLRGTIAATMWLDGIVAAAAMASVTAIAAPGRGEGALAYPFGDVALLILAAGAIALLGRRAGQVMIVVALGLATCAVFDAARLLGGIELRAPVVALLAAAVAVLPRRRTSPPAAGNHIALPAVFTLVALGVLIADQADPLPDAAVALALAVPFLLVLRLALSLRENAALLTRSQEEAMTDALTGLGNRRALMDALRAALADGHWRLALFDLDGFKAYNDTFGHVAGDVLIEHLGGRLSASVKGVGHAFRMGGDEFCVLVPADLATAALVRAQEALTEEGDGFRIGASVGIVELPGDAADAEEALQIADRRMYGQKEGRPHSPARQSGDVLVKVLAERRPELVEHARAVAVLARVLATTVGVEEEEREAIVRAAELHDIGKVAIPDAILEKPGPLAGDEEAFMRRHVTIGEEIIAEAPSLRRVAELVRASHERWDGGGYPDGLAGEHIPRGARVIAICDAFAAMRQDRPYGEVLGEADALDELRRAAGTQFDPALVAAFCVMRASSGPEPFATLAAPGERFIRAARLKPSEPGVELLEELP